MIANLWKRSILLGEKINPNFFADEFVANSIYLILHNSTQLRWHLAVQFL